MKIYVLNKNEDESNMLDELLWQYRDDSFIPHDLYHPTREIIAPIVLGHTMEVTPPFTEVLINLTHNVPPFYNQFLRIIEVVGSDADVKQQCREKYKFYQKHNIPIMTHTVN